MRAYFNMTTAEFVAQLRDIAIKAGAKALVIDQIDAIPEGSTQEEIEKAYDEGYKAGHAEREIEEIEKAYDDGYNAGYSEREAEEL